MTNKIIIIGVVSILVVGLVFLGLEVKNLRAEITQLSRIPSATTHPDQQAVKPKFTRPDDPWLPVNIWWDPYDELSQIQSQMNRLFSETSRNKIWQRGFPDMNIYEVSKDIKDAKDKYIISMDIPGMEKENINVEVKNNILLVTGERNNGNEEKSDNYYRQERSFGYFSQSLPLPGDANSSGISVEYKKGVLTIEIPKLEKTDTQHVQSTIIPVN